ncbi:MAG: glycosyltransferase family 4 protein [Caldisericaceae bacterium]|jgi:glycosyltransferase involved in cell wall biosynthesis
MRKESIIFLRSNPVYPDPRVEKEALSLSKNGFKVIIVAWDREDKFPSYESKVFADIYRLKVKADFGTGLKNVKHLLKWQLALLLWLAKNRNRFSCIHACDFDTIIPALVCKLLYKKKVVYDIFDFYADMLRNVPNTLKKIIRKIDLFLIGIADTVIIADESRLKQVEGSHPKKLVIIYNSPAQYSVSERGREIKDIGKSYDLIISYVGLLQHERGILEMIKVVKKNKNWKLNLGGFGGDEEIIRQYCESADNIVFFGRVPYQKTLEIYAESDVLFATYDPSIPNHRYSSANKLFEAMMLGKPIIVARNTGMDLTVQKYNLGFVIDYGDEAQLEDVLKRVELWDSITKRDFAERVSSLFEENFSWVIMEKRLVKIYIDLCEAK